MEKIMDIDSSESIKEITINAKERYRTLNNLFRDIPKQRYSLDLMKTILSNHNPKGAICRHYGIGNEIGNTTFSYIMVSQQRKFLVADGYPCCTKFKEIFLK